jgi:hypothetical protein
VGAQSEAGLGASLEAPVTIPATRFEHLPLGPLSLDPRTGIGPDDAATIALYSNPALRAIRVEAQSICQLFVNRIWLSKMDFYKIDRSRRMERCFLKQPAQ